MAESPERRAPGFLGRLFGGKSSTGNGVQENGGSVSWSMGVLNPQDTIEVPGSVLLLAQHRNQPLGLRNAPARTSHSTIPAGIPNDADLEEVASPQPPRTPAEVEEEKKKTADGKIILDPQPDDSANDPLNWPAWRRDAALLSLGFYCMVGGGVTPILAAGFTDVAEDYHVEVETVALTTGLYMMGLGIGSVIASPTAILYGKRPVYLVSAVIFIVTSIWCAASPNFSSLVVARIFQGISVSPVECLPSATIAEIFFLHERAYRIGIYTLLLLGGKNLVPLVSAAVIQSLGWRWVFWVIAMVVGFGFVILFLFVPETFWDRTPVPKSRKPSRRPSFLRRLSSRAIHPLTTPAIQTQPSQVLPPPTATPHGDRDAEREPAAMQLHPSKNVHVGFVEAPENQDVGKAGQDDAREDYFAGANPHVAHNSQPEAESKPQLMGGSPHHDHPRADVEQPAAASAIDGSTVGHSHSGYDGANAPSEKAIPVSRKGSPSPSATTHHHGILEGSATPSDAQGSGFNVDTEKFQTKVRGPPTSQRYTHALRQQPPRTFVQHLRPFHGRLNHDNWFRVMLRPFFLFAYPSVLWSAAVYACSVGWLIVVSESIAMIYRDQASYNFDAIQTGLVYISPFVGGILGTAVAGKVSDIIVKAMAARNGGLYEPEFRLVMAIPVLITTVIGLMGFGWSAEERDHWIVPTVFFGIISFGCSLGSTTAITFCVDSYRQYAGEALVTLNFTKNIFHGLVFSLFVTHWLSHDGSKAVYVWIGVIQLIVLLFTIPMYIYGKRARMWTVRKNFMEKF